MKFLIIFLLLAGICFAEDFTTDNLFDAGELAKEIEVATGITLTGENQQGFMNTAGDKVEIELKDRKLTQEEKQKINNAIIAHIPETEEQKEAEKEQKEAVLLDKFGWTNADLKTLKEIFAK